MSLNTTQVAIVLGVIAVAAVGGATVMVLGNGDSPAEYTVTFNAAENGGEVVGESTIKVSDGKQLSFSQTATKSKSQFLGWFTESEGGIQITSDSVNVTADVTYYAHFLDLYTVTFNADANGGTVVGDNTIDFVKDSNFVFTQTAVKEGYDFLGWFTESDCKNQISSGTGTPVTGDTTLYAGFQIRTFAVKAPVSSTGYTVTAEDKTVNYGSSYTFTIAAPSGKYSGELDVTAEGSHGEITSSKSESTITVTIPDIKSDIESIVLSGYKEIATGSFVDYTLSGSYVSSSLSLTVDGSYKVVYEALSKDTGYYSIDYKFDYLKEDGTVYTTYDEESTAIALTFFGEDPVFDTEGYTVSGTRVVMTVDGSKTLTDYTHVNGTKTTKMSIDSSTGILYYMESSSNDGSVAVTLIWNLSSYHLDLTDPYTDFSRIGKSVTMNVKGDTDGSGFTGTMEYALVAQSSSVNCIKTTINLKLDSDSSVSSTETYYTFDERDSDSEPIVPIGATNDGTVKEMTILGEKELTIWKYTENGSDYTVYLGDYEGDSLPYKMIIYTSEDKVTMECTLAQLTL